MTVSLSAADGGGSVNGGGRRVLAAKTDSVSNVNNNNNNEPAQTVTAKAAVHAVRRILFGPPAAPAETRAWLDRQLCAANAANNLTWNFDFVNERPMRDSPADRYVWERVILPPQQQQRNICMMEPSEDNIAATADDSTARPQDYLTAAIKQKQSKVTDFMLKTKKRPMSVAASNNKIVDGELAPSANKRSRRSYTTI